MHAPPHLTNSEGLDEMVWARAHDENRKHHDKKQAC